MGLLPAVYAKYIGFAQAQFKHYSKPVVVWVAVAIVANRVWGKSVLIIYTLGSLFVYVRMGPNFPLLKALEGKTIVIASMLLSNSYFKMVNPYWLGLYAGFCMLVRDWDLLSMVNRLDGLNGELKTQNKSLQEARHNLSNQLSDVRNKFNKLLTQANATETSRSAVESAEIQLEQQATLTEETLEKKLKDIESLVQLIISDPDFKERMQELERVQQRAEELQAQNEKALAKQRTLLTSFAQLENQLTVVLTQVVQLQGQYRDQVEQIQRTLGRLRQSLPPLPS